MSNIFHEVETVDELMYQVVGAGSVCWENLNNTGVFQDQQARFVAEEALTRLKELQTPEGQPRVHPNQAELNLL